MNAFTTIHDNFVTLLENTVVPYVADKYRESQAIDLKSVKTSDPASIWNRAYSIQAKGMNGVTELFNNLGYLEYDIVLQLAYELSYQGDKTKYNTANDEVATIIQKRIDPTSFQNVMTSVEHTNTSEFYFTGKSETEVFAVVEVTFHVQYEMTTF